MPYATVEKGARQIKARIVCLDCCLIDDVMIDEGILHTENPCKECMPLISEVEWSNDDSNVCDDGLFCTVGDHCLSGECTGLSRDCSDVVQSPGCQRPRCDEDTDTCVAEIINEGLHCDDGKFCTIGESCRAGECIGGVKRDCSWAVQWEHCQVGYCNEGEDACVASPVNEGGRCSDGQYCTVGEKCRGGECVGGEPLDCSDAVTEPQCQVGFCDLWRPACVAVPVNEGRSCTSPDPCIGNAVCMRGECVGEGICDVGGGGCGCGGRRASGVVLIGVVLALGLRRRCR